MSDQNPPKDAVRFEWTGRNLGSITLQNIETGNAYPVGFNMDHRFVWIAKEDLDWAAKQPGLIEQPLDEPAADEGNPKPPKPNSRKPAAKTKDAADGTPADGDPNPDGTPANAPIVDA